MMTTTAVRVVVCAWCGTEGAGMCPDCAEAQAQAESYLRKIGKFSQENLCRAMGAYLTSHWAHKVDGRWVCNNESCGVEPLVLGPECPACGWRGRKGFE